MPKYILKRGQEHWGKEQGQTHLYRGDDPDNNEINLSTPEYNAFRDKFATVADIDEALAVQQAALAEKPTIDVLEQRAAAVGFTLAKLTAPAKTPYTHPDKPSARATARAEKEEEMAKKAANEPVEEEREEYILRPGHTHHGLDEDGNRVAYVGGEKDNDRVLLSKDQFAALRDKFESQEGAKQRVALEKDAADAKATLEEARTKLALQGINLDDLLKQAEKPIEKPNPSPSVGTAEPTIETVTPAPVGSTSDPVVHPPHSPATPAVAPVDTSSQKTPAKSK